MTNVNVAHTNAGIAFKPMPTAPCLAGLGQDAFGRAFALTGTGQRQR